MSLLNDGPLGAHFQARFLVPAAPPRSYTVGAGDRLTDNWQTVGPYDVELHGPNGLFRRFAGDRSQDHASASMRDRNGRIVVTVIATRAAEVVLTDTLMQRRPKSIPLHAGGHHKFDVPTRETGGRYDLTLTVTGTPFTRQFAGHIETGKPSIGNPALGR